MHSYRILAALPPYGPTAIPFPAAWGQLGREGTVVELRPPAGDNWIANFARGNEGVTDVVDHPDGRRVIVLSCGDAWIVDTEKRSATTIAAAIHAMWPLKNPDGFLLDRQGMALLRLDATGVRWHTRRLSWDGFDQLDVGASAVTGQAWNAAEELWQPFEVDLESGRSIGGGYDSLDRQEWERLA
jgi:hypothetical protein